MNMKFILILMTSLLVGVVGAAEKVVKVKASDFAYLFTKEDLKPYGFKLDESGASESTTLTNYDDGSRMLEYTYDTIGKEGFTEMFIAVYVDYEPVLATSKKTYQGNIDEILKADKKGGMEHRKEDPAVKLGEATDYYVRVRKGEDNGFLYTVRSGNFCYTVVSSGVISDNGELFRDEIQARIRKLIDRKR